MGSEQSEPGMSLKLLCHVAELTQRGLMPGTAEEQGALLRFLHAAIEPSLPTMSLLNLATALWGYAAVGVASDWTDALLQRVGGWVGGCGGCEHA